MPAIRPTRPSRAEAIAAVLLFALAFLLTPSCELVFGDATKGKKMETYYQADGIALHCGDCRHVMSDMEADSVDAIVTDPPYGLKFMGRDWDHGVPGQGFWCEPLRVAKPGAHLLAFGGTRTHHRLMCAIEDAGWEIRDCLMWVYGSGFPKSLDVSKAIDKAAGAEREVVSVGATRAHGMTGGHLIGNDGKPETRIETAPATEAAKQWDGWGTALKPAWEPIIMARKPIEGTVAANVQKWGVGGINVDGCRVGASGEDSERLKEWHAKYGGREYASGDVYEINNGTAHRRISPPHSQGRFPANLIHDGSDEVLAGFPQSTARAAKSIINGGTSGSGEKRSSNCYGGGRLYESHIGYDDTEGSAARFFYTAKASKADRTPGNNHPTVKPLDLMRYLVRLVCPIGGTVLDPFNGSGATTYAAREEHCKAIGIELSAEYCAIAVKRLPQGVLDFSGGS